MTTPQLLAFGILGGTMVLFIWGPMALRSRRHFCTARLSSSGNGASEEGVFRLQ
jgi:hypothetical protein